MVCRLHRSSVRALLYSPEYQVRLGALPACVTLNCVWCFACSSASGGPLALDLGLDPDLYIPLGTGHIGVV